MRADRLLSIILHLQVDGRLTARELARRLEVSERTILRDMDALSGAGIPVIAERGIGGGWMLMEGYKTNLTGLTDSEIQALFVTKPSRLLSDLKLEKASEGALTKLLAALPAMYRRDVEYARQRIHIDVTGWTQSEESVPVLPILQEAIWQERKLHFAYNRGDGESFERTADPLGLVAKGSVWYLVAAIEDETRSYRVSRIQSAKLSDQPAIRPADFDLAAFWSRSSAEFKANVPRYMASIRVAPRVIPRLRFIGKFARIENIGEADESGWSTVTIRFQFEEDACETLLGFGPYVDVLEPSELKEQILERARELLKFYGE